MKVKDISKIICGIFLFYCCSGQTSKTIDPVIYADSSDPELEQAKQDAIANIDLFIDSFKKNSGDTLLQFSIKADFVDNGIHEHMWISLSRIDNDLFNGFLGNDPQTIKNVKFGDPVTLNRDQIEDWLIYNTTNETWQGGYSIKVLQKRK